ncbi:MAG: hypothetical protein QOC81_2557 [Thermoanaerobaculia bacterium]|jgi:tetratricopeptide (TPR) repeat protein|nr:hypothetical protein [Thermoanaerobaculia bacterium]
MTTLSTHPAAEDLGCFIDGTLDARSRAAIVEHIADCDECRFTVVDVTAFGEELAPPERAKGRWWVAAAAAIAITVGGTFVVQARRDPLAPVIEASSRQSSRLVEARLSGFPHVVRKAQMRGRGSDPDYGVADVIVAADKVLHRGGDNARMQHARGVAQLLDFEARLAEREGDTSDEGRAERQMLVDQRNAAIPILQKAANLAPDNAAYQSDVAAALIATGTTPNFKAAVEACDRALKIEPNSADALFNQAQALDLLAQKSGEATDVTNAIKAYNKYLDVDPSSPWADEARKKIADLQQAP